ncbi:type II toxin-antitoxin system death-on-curing family toxin [Desulfolucanica intricata]|uniref:type II toxin-antitoxin system death-on-curing family toxin n=1 Tax=Desulfolucanica intricata TaxID=1285191 RepID=UPI0008333539|nr:type II toxin-antitoxin system death-on-curing family toxin [Desulfolucanica intricata]
MVKYLNAEQVKTLHNLIDPQTTTIKDKDALITALAGPQATISGEDAYSTIDEKAAVLLDHLINEKPFKTANRRTALLAYLVFLYLNNHQVTASTGKLVELVDSIASKTVHISDLVNFTRHATKVVSAELNNFNEAAELMLKKYENALDALS